MQNTTIPNKRDELHETEKSAQVMGRESSINIDDISPASSPQRCGSSSYDSSMYIEDESYYDNSYTNSNEMSWQSSAASMQQRKSTASSGPRRNSCLVSSGGMLGLSDVDFDDSDEDGSSGPPKAPPATGTGSPSHRPMVGGFAAAAYEAARADHFKKQQEKKSA